MNLFADVSDASVAPVFDEQEPVGKDEYPKAQRLAFEKEMLGLYVSDHPLLGVEHALRRLVDGPFGRSPREAGG